MTKLKDNCVLRWNSLLLATVKIISMKPPTTARAIALIHTAMYDSWAHFDAKAIPVYIEKFRRADQSLWNDANRQKAMSYAAFNVLCDLFPQKERQAAFLGLMKEYKYNANDQTTYSQNDPLTPEKIGNTAAKALLKAREADGSNQNETSKDFPEGYADTSGSYELANSAKELCNINHWQPLEINTKEQIFLYPHWRDVKPFAIGKPSSEDLKPPPPIKYPRDLPVKDKEEINDPDEQAAAKTFEQNCKDVLDFSKNLDDERKMIAEYWMAAGGTVTPPGMWCQIAHWVSLRDKHTLSEDAQLFFAMGNALMDASIACWYSKRRYDYCRPITAIRALLDNCTVQVWGGAYQGMVNIPARQWQTYIPTPPFPEYVSGHSTFSCAGAAILQYFKGNDFLGMSVKLLAGSSIIEPGLTPAYDVVLYWKRFSDAAQQAGLSRCYGGIHFVAGNTEGLALGERVAQKVWQKTQLYWKGIQSEDPEVEDCD